MERKKKSRLPSECGKSSSPNQGADRFQLGKKRRKRLLLRLPQGKKGGLLPHHRTRKKKKTRTFGHGGKRSKQRGPKEVRCFVSSLERKLSRLVDRADGRRIHREERGETYERQVVTLSTLSWGLGWEKKTSSGRKIRVASRGRSETHDKREGNGRMATATEGQVHERRIMREKSVLWVEGEEEAPWKRKKRKNGRLGIGLAGSREKKHHVKKDLDQQRRRGLCGRYWSWG